MIQSPAEKIRFDVFEVDPRAGELLKKGQRIKLQEQPYRVLSLLLQRSGEVVTRDELRQELWPADTFVDFDHGLNSAVARLREALRDSAEKPRFIETVIKRGYRFIAPIQPKNRDGKSNDADNNDEDQLVPVSVVGARSRLRSARLYIAAMTCLALVCSASIWALYRPHPARSRQRLR